MKSLPIGTRVEIQRMSRTSGGIIKDKYPGGRYGTKYLIRLDFVEMWHGVYTGTVEMYFHEFKIKEKSSKS